MKTPTAFIAAVLTLVFATMASAAETKAPAGAVVLTVAGNVANTNRPAYDDKRDVFLKYQERAFDKAFAFDRAMLESLGVTEIRIAYKDWDSPITFSGPRLADVLKTAGCGGEPLATLALDGFKTEMSEATVKAHDWVLATRAACRRCESGIVIGSGPAPPNGRYRAMAHVFGLATAGPESEAPEAGSH